MLGLTGELFVLIRHPIMAPEAEDTAAAVVAADLPTEAVAATEEEDSTAEEEAAAEEHPLVTALLPTCISSRLRMAVATHSSSLSMACPRKVFQNQLVVVTIAVLIAEKMLTLLTRLRRPSTIWCLPECSSAATTASPARRRRLLSKSNEAAADSHPESFPHRERFRALPEARVIEK
jgi:hypothetical protein